MKTIIASALTIALAVGLWQWLRIPFDPPKDTHWATRIEVELLLWRLDRVDGWKNAVAINRKAVAMWDYSFWVVVTDESHFAWREAIRAAK